MNTKNLQGMSDELMEEFHDYTNGIRVLMLIDRNINNSRHGKLFRFISRNREEFRTALLKALKILEESSNSNTDLRIYTTVNARNFEKAVRLLKHRQIDIDSESQDRQLSFYVDVSNIFISCLMKPENKETNFFLLDLDSDQLDELLKTLEKLKIVVLSHHKTKKGHHLITKPFNPTLLNFEKCEIKKDSLVMLYGA